MAINAKQRQKKLERKSKKRKQVKQSLNKAKVTEPKAIHFCKYPVDQCLVPENLFQDGLGTVLITRETSFGQMAVSAFLLDVYCLGVKDAMFSTMSSAEFGEDYVIEVEHRANTSAFKLVSAAYLRKLVEQCAAYAKSLGFGPHPDYQNAKLLFGDIDVAACDETFEFGYKGKPYYRPGPYETESDVMANFAKLLDSVGEDNFHFIDAEDQMEVMEYPEFIDGEGMDLADESTPVTIEGEVLNKP